MKRGLSLLAAAVLALLFNTCSFETDGNFSGYVAGYEKGRQPLLPPTNVRATADSNGGIEITWAMSANADGYFVYRSPAAIERYRYRGPSGGMTYTDSGDNVVPNTPYYYYVIAYKGGEQSRPSDSFGPVYTTVKNDEILDKPEIINAVVLGNDITVTWTPVTGAEGYIVYRHSQYDGDFFKFHADAATTSYKDENLATGSYTYIVRGVKNNEEGYPSLPWGPEDIINIDPVPDPVPPPTPPSQPQNVRAVLNSSQPQTVTITWNAAANASFYHVYRSADDELIKKVGETSSTTYQDTTVADGKAYYYSVQGYNGTQSGYMSNSVGPVLTLPGKPVITASASANTINVEWAAVLGADTYNVYRSTNNTQFQLLSRTVRETSYTDLGLARGTYYYRVEAVNFAGSGPVSDSKSAEVVQNAAAPVISVHPVSSTYFLNMSASPLSVQASASGTLSYQWYSNTTNSNSGGTLVSSAATYTPPTNTAGTFYYYVIVTNTDNSVNGNKTATAVSNTAAVTVQGGGGGTVNAATPSISVHPAGNTYALNASASALSVTASASDGGTLSYQWYRNTTNSNSGGTLVSSAATYTPPTNTGGTFYYYAVVTNTNNSVNGTKTAAAASNAAAITVTVNAATPVISVHPVGGTYLQNVTASALSVTASVSDGGVLSYQWYSNSANSNSGGTAVGTGAAYTPSTAAAGTLYYYVVVTNTNNSVNGTKTATAVSNTAAIEVFSTVTSTNEWNNALTSIKNGGNDKNYTITINGDVPIDGTTVDSFGTASGITVTLTGNGKLLYANSFPDDNLIRLAANQTLIIDSAALTLQGKSRNDYSVVYLNGSNAQLELRNGTISGNNYTDKGGGVYVGDGSNFVMSGGTISGNTYDGGYASGGGVYVEGGTFTMSGGVISGNTSSSMGSGVSLQGGIFTMTGGTISNNSGSTTGGGIYVRGTFIMTDGEISNNTATLGGGIYINSGGNFTMYDGTISNNTINGNAGGGVYMGGGNFAMYGGTISGNTAAGNSTNGGGIYIQIGTFTMYGGTISGNTADSGNPNLSYGGGVYMFNGVFRIVTGTIYGSNASPLTLRNTAKDGGSALYFRSDSPNAQRGFFSGDTWNNLGDLSTTNDTINVEDGDLK